MNKFIEISGTIINTDRILYINYELGKATIFFDSETNIELTGEESVVLKTYFEKITDKIPVIIKNTKK